MFFSTIVRKTASVSLLCSIAHGFAFNPRTASRFGLKNADVRVISANTKTVSQRMQSCALIHPFLFLHCFHSILSQQQKSFNSLSVVTQDASSRFFQLEELEDRYSCITEIFLEDDKTVDVMATDGPV
jgi:glutathionylspermidine synthase